MYIHDYVMVLICKYAVISYMLNCSIDAKKEIKSWAEVWFLSNGLKTVPEPHSQSMT